VKMEDFGFQAEKYWLVVWNMAWFYDFPYVGKNNPNWRTHIYSYFSEGLKPPTRIRILPSEIVTYSELSQTHRDWMVI
jgi:hypothetical protein